MEKLMEKIRKCYICNVTLKDMNISQVIQWLAKVFDRLHLQISIKKNEVY